MSDHDKTQRVPDPLQPQNRVERTLVFLERILVALERLLFGWLHRLPPWHLGTAIEMAGFTAMISIIGGCIVFTGGFLVGVFPLRQAPEPPPQQHEQPIDGLTYEDCARRLSQFGWKSP